MSTNPAVGSRAVGLGVANWPGLAAAPGFALMALLTGIPADEVPNGFCSVSHQGSLLEGMTLMYVLMSVFHLGPWLRLVLRR